MPTYTARPDIAQLPENTPNITRLHFNNSTDYHTWLTSTDRVPNHMYSHGGYGSSEHALRTGIAQVKDGNPNVEAINALVEKFQLQVETPQRITRPSTRGHRVNIAAYLADAPLQMYQRDTEPSDRSPLRIWVGTVSSIGISPEKVTQRGAALAAFAISLSAMRTVYITPYSYLFNGNNPGEHSSNRYRGSRDGGVTKGAVISTDLSSSPLYVNELAAHMNVAGARYTGMWACHCAHPACDGGATTPYQDEQAMRALLGAAPDDIYLGGIHLSDPLMRDPIKWITDNIAKYTDPDYESESDKADKSDW